MHDLAFSRFLYLLTGEVTFLRTHIHNLDVYFSTRASYQSYLEGTAQADAETTRVQVQKKLELVVRNELSPQQREVIQLYYGEGMTLPQIASRLGIHKSTASRRLKSARARIETYLRYVVR